MSARHRRPAPVPLRYHFGLTAAVAAAFLFALIVLAHEGDPAILGSAAVPATGLLVGTGKGGRHRMVARSRVTVTWEAWHCADWPARARRGAVLFGRWLLADDHVVTLLQLGAVLTVVGVVVAASPAGVAIPAATILLAVAVVGLVLAVVHRHDPAKAGSVLGGKGGAR